MPNQIIESESREPPMPQLTFDLPRPPRRRTKKVFVWGGRREGAGRKPAGERAKLRHQTRPRFNRRMPVHVTLRVAAHVYNLRSRRSFRVIERALLVGGDRFGVQLTGFSIQGNHLHLMGEAPGDVALGRAMQGFGVRVARGLNKMMGKTGAVFADRYHVHVLRTPTEVANAIRYVRDNARKHAAERGESYSAGYVDPFSSAARTDLVRPARTWLLTVGWQRASRRPSRRGHEPG
jgi:REP element-mobilizing transposase RayT